MEGRMEENGKCVQLVNKKNNNQKPRDENNQLVNNYSLVFRYESCPALDTG